MKKLLTLLIGLMMIMGVAAQIMPAPVKFVVSVNGQKIDYAQTRVTNLETSEVITTNDKSSLRIINGVGLFDLSDFKINPSLYSPIPYGLAGNTIEYVVCNVHSLCTGTFVIDHFNPRPIVVSITDTSIPPMEYQCWDGSIVTDLNNCPPIPEPDPEPKVIIETKVSSNDAKTVANVEADYGQLIDIVLTNKKLVKLFDGEVSFNGDKYDAKEVITIQATPETSIFDEDFGTEPRIIFEERTVEYKFIIEDPIDLSEIDEEESLDIPFSGGFLKIIEAGSDYIVVRTGIEVTLNEGQSVEVDGKTVKIVSIAEDSVEVNVNNVNKIIAKEDNREVNGIYVLIDTIHYKNQDSDFKSSTTIIAGTETDETIRNGDEYQEREDWEWVINGQSWGYINTEAYKGIDEDDEYHALGEKDSLVLPNDFLKINFKSITTSEVTEMTLRVKDGYLYIRGDVDAFSYGTEEYNRLYIDSNGFHDEDKEFITTENIRIGDSEVYLELGSLKIGKLVIMLDMSDILYDGISYLTEEGNFLDYLGIVFKDPENAIQDKEGFKVIVPEDKPEVTISFTIKLTEVKEPVITTTPVDDDEDTDVVVTPPVTPPVVPPVTPDPVIKIICEDGTEVDKAEDCREEDVGDSIFKLALEIFKWFGWGAGFVALAYWYYKKGEKVRAFKMLNTAIKNALLGKYKKK